MWCCSVETSEPGAADVPHTDLISVHSSQHSHLIDSGGISMSRNSIWFLLMINISAGKSSCNSSDIFGGFQLRVGKQNDKGYG